MTNATPPRPSSRSALRYQEMEVLSATPGELVALAYDHLLACLLRARAATVARRAEERATEVGRAVETVGELLVTLDRARGGDVATQLAALYAFFLRELTSFGAAPSVERLDRIVSMVRQLREAFAGIQHGAGQ